MKRSCRTSALEALEPRTLLSAAAIGAGGGAYGQDVRSAYEVGADPLPSPIELTSPTVGANTTTGETFDITWSGGYAGATVQIWSAGPDGWQLEADNVPAELGQYTWSTDGRSHGWYAFGAWVRHADGQMVSSVSPDWVHVNDPSNRAPELNFITGAASAQYSLGQPLTVQWSASDADGDNTQVWLWVYSLASGWQSIGEGLDGAAGQATWSTSAAWVTEGWYCFGAWIGDGSAWTAAISASFVRLSPQQTDGAGDTVTARLVTESGLTYLHVNGTDQADTITIAGAAGGVALTSGTATSTYTGTFAGITINGYAGDDLIRVTNDLSLPTKIYAGTGNDKIYCAGMGADSIWAGDGDDLVVAIGGGVDTIRGEAGLDSFWVGTNDTLADTSSSETNGKTVHRVGSFYSTHLSSGSTPYEVAGQDILDPTLTSTSYVYKDFSSRPLFVGAPTLDDVNQGNVGDCYFLSTLASLALTDPQILTQMVTALGDGSYAVRFYDSGQEVYVRVDGQLATYSATSNSLVYARTGPSNQIWVPIVEKAYAVMRRANNSYSALNAGWMSEVYRRVTNLGSDDIYMPSMSATQLWQTIRDALAAGHGACVGSTSAGAGPIVGNHAYTIVSATSSGGILYVTVFNPWGYDGRTWDDNSTDGLLKLTIPELTAAFQYGTIAQA